MKIKQRNPSLPIADKINKSKPLTLSILTLSGLAVALMLFFGLLGYGAYLHKIGKSVYYRQLLVNMANLDFSFLRNYATAQWSDIDEFKLDIKFKHLLRIQYLREQALEEGLITEAIKEEEFPAELTVDGQTYKVDIGLTGLITEHLIDPVKWSFQVKVKGEHTIRGMKRFSLLIPNSRGYLTDWIGFEIAKERGLMGTRVDFVDLSINGKPLGVYYLEERIDKYMVENNRLRDGVFFILEDDLSIYREDKLLQDPAMKDQVLLVRRTWQNVAAGQTPPDQFFDLKKMAKLAAVCDLMNNKHPLMRRNLRYYFNPVTSLAEPIGREWEFLEENSLEEMRLFLEKPKERLHFWLTQDSVLQMISQNPDFKRFYLEEAAVLSQPEFLDNLVARREAKLRTLVDKVFRTWPFYELPLQLLYDQQTYLRQTLFPDVPMVSAYLERKEADQLIIRLENRQDLPLEVPYISWRDTLFFLPDHPLTLDSKNETPRKNIPLLHFRIPDNIAWADSLLPELRLHYHLLGLPQHAKTTLVFPWPYEERLENAENPIERADTYRNFAFLREIPAEHTISIPKGTWTLEEDLVIPKNMRFRIKAGARIDLRRGAKIITYSPVFCLGTEEEPILIYSSDLTGQGMTVMNANQRSELSHVVFENISRPKDGGWQLSGAVTFYESPVSIRSCTFSGNREGDDFLNIIRSDFSMDQSLFKDIAADAFDCDFCTGTVSHTSFTHIGNDGVDVSGTDITLCHIFLNHIGDKGLSAGENSTMNAQWITIRDAEIGITAKDQSLITLSDAKMENSKIGVTLFQKKSEFGPGYMNARRVDIKGSEIPFLIEENSTMFLDGQAITSNKDRVREILYGVEYGKSSK